MKRATPNPGTKMLTATCLECGGVIYKKPHQPWFHDDDGLVECQPGDHS